MDLAVKQPSGVKTGPLADVSKPLIVALFPRDHLGINGRLCSKCDCPGAISEFGRKDYSAKAAHRIADGIVSPDLV